MLCELTHDLIARAVPRPPWCDNSLPSVGAVDVSPGQVGQRRWTPEVAAADIRARGPDSPRRDRPGFPTAPRKNFLLFTFQLGWEPNEKKFMQINAPLGFLIANDCTDKIEVRMEHILGPFAKNGFHCHDDYMTNCQESMKTSAGGCIANPTNNRCRMLKHSTQELYAVSGYEDWPPGAFPTGCQGFGHYAKIELPVGLDDSINYVFRLEVDSNPPATPDPNQWSLSYSGESSPLFDGFVLQTLTSFTVSPVSRARRSNNDADAFVNPVEFGFVPSQEIPVRKEIASYGGFLMLKRPPGYSFADQSGLSGRRRELLASTIEERSLAQISHPIQGKKCVVDLRSEDLNTVFKYDIDVICVIDPATGDIAVYNLSLNKKLVVDKVFLMTVYVFNSATIIGPGVDQGTFQLESYDDEANLLDLARIPGFDILNILNSWQVLNPAGVQNGMTPVPQIEFIVSFPDPLEFDDELHFLAPLGFDLKVPGTAGQCNNFQWTAG